MCPHVCSSVLWSASILFPDDNLSKWIFTKLGIRIDIVEIWFGIANVQISSIFSLPVRKCRKNYCTPPGVGVDVGIGISVNKNVKVLRRSF